MCESKPTVLSEPVRATVAESPRPTSRVHRVGRVRLPIAGAYRPWATLYRLPDHRLIWCVRLWHIDQPHRRCVSTAVLRQFARTNGLIDLLEEIDSLVSQGSEQNDLP
jgi:hypothetical protein